MNSLIAISSNPGRRSAKTKKFLKFYYKVHKYPCSTVKYDYPLSCAI